MDDVNGVFWFAPTASRNINRSMSDAVMSVHLPRIYAGCGLWLLIISFMFVIYVAIYAVWLGSLAFVWALQIAVVPLWIIVAVIKHYQGEK